MTLPPEVKELQEQTVVEGRDVQLNCTFYSAARVEVAWMKVNSTDEIRREMTVKLYMFSTSLFFLVLLLRISLLSFRFSSSSLLFSSSLFSLFLLLCSSPFLFPSLFTSLLFLFLFSSFFLSSSFLHSLLPSFFLLFCFFLFFLPLLRLLSSFFSVVPVFCIPLIHNSSVEKHGKQVLVY